MFGAKKKHTTPVTRRCFYTHCLRPCTTITEETCLYHYWVGSIGKTVRITEGAFSREVGRLNAVTCDSGQVLCETGRNFTIAPQNIWVSFTSLKVVETTLPTHLPCCGGQHSVCRDHRIEECSACRETKFPEFTSKIIDGWRVYYPHTGEGTATMKVILRQTEANDYRVEGLQNITTPRIGQYLSAVVVDKMCNAAHFESAVEVEIR